jgi:CheY-like chemotaxis protein
VSGGEGPTILLIEPDEESVVILREILQDRLCQPVFATTGSEGLAMCEKEPPDLVVVSLELGSTSGFAVCKKLRRHPRLSKVPVFLVSSEATTEVFDNHRRLRSRAEAYFRRPFEAQDFLAEIDRFFPQVTPVGPSATPRP